VRLLESSLITSKRKRRRGEREEREREEKESPTYNLPADRSLKCYRLHMTLLFWPKIQFIYSLSSTVKIEYSSCRIVV